MMVPIVGDHPPPPPPGPTFGVGAGTYIEGAQDGRVIFGSGETTQILMVAGRESAVPSLPVTVKDILPTKLIGGL